MESSQKIIITGTRTGLGREMALAFLQEGHQVAGCSRGESSIEHPHYRHFGLDVADETAVRAMMEVIRQSWNRVDVLLNNAGIASMNPALTTPLSTVERVFRTNVFGTFLFARETAKLMLPKRSGRIVNFSSVAVPLDLEGEAAYAASKSAIESLTRVLARELGQSGITVNGVGPTPIPTDLIRGVPPEKMEALIARQAIPRFGTVEDVLQVVRFLIAPGSSFVTGQIIYLGGVS